MGRISDTEIVAMLGGMYEMQKDRKEFERVLRNSLEQDLEGYSLEYQVKSIVELHDEHMKRCLTRNKHCGMVNHQEVADANIG